MLCKGSEKGLQGILKKELNMSTVRLKVNKEMGKIKAMHGINNGINKELEKTTLKSNSFGLTKKAQILSLDFN